MPAVNRLLAITRAGRCRIAHRSIQPRPVSSPWTKFTTGTLACWAAGANTACGQFPCVTTTSNWRTTAAKRRRARRTVHGREARTAPRSNTSTPVAANSFHTRPRKHSPKAGTISGTLARCRAIVTSIRSMPPYRLPDDKCKTFTGRRRPRTRPGSAAPSSHGRTARPPVASLPRRGDRAAPVRRASAGRRRPGRRGRSSAPSGSTITPM